MKKTLLILFIITMVVELYGQQDIVIGTSYHLNLQKKNLHGDAWILHNAEYSQGDDILKWKNTHTSFGSRGIRFAYSTGKGIYFYADDKATTTNVEFTPTTRFFIGNNGNLGIGTTTPGAKLHIGEGKLRLGASGTSTYTDIEHSASQFSIITNSDVRPLVLGTNSQEYMRIRTDGNIGIGTTETGTHKLAVEGTIGAREINVEAGNWSDFVFNENYELRNLEEVENFIEENNHLPDIPSEKEVFENGIQLGEMDAKLLQKIEELTLYMIEQNKETKFIKAQLNKLAEENNELKEKITKLEAVE